MWKITVVDSTVVCLKNLVGKDQGKPLLPPAKPVHEKSPAVRGFFVGADRDLPWTTPQFVEPASDRMFDPDDLRAMVPDMTGFHAHCRIPA
jgi:hypothetical protein